MMEDLHNIDDLFRSGLDGKEEAPEQKVWNAIEQELDKNNVISIREKYVQMRRASAILLILLLGVSIYTLRNTFNSNTAKSSGQQLSPSNKSGKDQPATKESPEKSSKGNSLTAIDQEVKDEAVNNSTDKSDKTVSSRTEITKNSSNQSVEGAKSSLVDLPEKGITNNKASDNKSKGNNSLVASSGTVAVGLLPNNSKTSTRNWNNKNKTTRQPDLTSTGSNRGNQRTINNAKPDKNKSGKKTSSDNSNLLPDETIASSEWTPASIETQSLKSVPSITIKLSSENALSDAVKSNPANNLSIPVKNKSHNKLDLPAFAITPMAAINLMSNTIESNYAHGATGNEKLNIENTESEKLSHTFALLFDVKIAPRLSIQTGVGYMEKTTSIVPKQIPAVRASDGKIKYQFDCSAGRYYLNPMYGTWPRVGDSAYTIATANELHYITVPLALKYYFGNNKLNFFALAGADANILLGQDLTTGLYGASYYGKKSTPQPIGLNSIYINAMLGGGVNYSINRWLGLTLSPVYKFALNPINKDMPFKAYPHSFSLAAGLRFSF